MIAHTYSSNLLPNLFKSHKNSVKIYPQPW